MSMMAILMMALDDNDDDATNREGPAGTPVKKDRKREREKGRARAHITSPRAHDDCGWLS